MKFMIRKEMGYVNRKVLKSSILLTKGNIAAWRTGAARTQAAGGEYPGDPREDPLIGNVLCFLL